MNTLLVVMAHPDDAELYFGGGIARLIHLGWDVIIVSVTDGACGTVRHTAKEISEIRLREGQSAAQILGASHVNLAFRDSHLHGHEADIQKALITLLREHRPTAVITHFPDRNWEYHPDHCLIGTMMSYATFQFRLNNMEADLPLPSDCSLVELYYVDPRGSKNEFGEIFSADHIVRLCDEEVLLAIEAVKAHQSQFELFAQENLELNQFALNWWRFRGSGEFYAHGITMNRRQNFSQAGVLLEALRQEE